MACLPEPQKHTHTCQSTLLSLTESGGYILEVGVHNNEVWCVMCMPPSENPSNLCELCSVEEGQLWNCVATCFVSMQKPQEQHCKLDIQKENLNYFARGVLLEKPFVARHFTSDHAHLRAKTHDLQQVH